MDCKRLLWWLGMGGLSMLAWTGVYAQDSFEPAAEQVVQATIGAGTAASCQTNAAVNAFTNAVMAGGVINFNCGSEFVTMNVNTSVVDKTVTVNGGGKVRLSGESLRQLFLVLGTGRLTLNDIWVDDGSASSGGAIAVQPQGRLTINRSSLGGNEASSDGGAIHNRGTLVIDDTIIGGNSADGNGGAVFNNGGTVTIRRSYLINNEGQNGGAVYTVNGALTITQTAVRSNRAGTGGGGLFAAGETAIADSTFSNNRAMNQRGGAVYAVFPMTINNSTFNENQADQGGAIYRAASANPMTIKNSIVTGSRAWSSDSPSLNCDGPTITTLGRNIISDNSCVPNPGQNGDLLGTDPKLGPWYIPLHAYVPNADSPAIDRGVGCAAVDQRGLARPIGAACDVGSIERGWRVFMPLVDK